MSPSIVFSNKIKWFGRGFGALIFLTIVCGFNACKQSDETPGPQPVTFTIAVYNHMLAGVQKTITKEGYANNTLQLSSSEIGIPGVSQLYMSARKPNIGARLATATNGVLNVPTTTETSIDVHCFSLEGVSEDYFAQIMGQGPVLVAGRDSKWYRKNFDGYTSNNEFQAEWDHAFNQVNNAFQNPFPVGSCNPQGGSWSYGYGNSPFDGDKDYGKKAIWTNSIALHNNSYAITRTNLEELFEAHGRINDIGGGGDIVMNGTNLNQTGHNLARFYMLMAE